MTLTDQLSTNTDARMLQEIFEFVRPHFRDTDANVLYDLIQQHYLYGTIDAVYRGQGMVACCRWNISPSGKLCEVLDLVVKPGEDGFKLMKHLVARNWHRFPTCEYIAFKRDGKYADRKMSYLPIKQLLKVRKS